MSIMAPFRAYAISTELAWADVLGLQGTKRKAHHTFSHTLQNYEHHFAIEAGWRKTSSSNKAAGVAIWLSKSTFSQAQVVDISTPPSRLQGRGIACRVYKRGVFDYLFSSLYFAPKPQKAHEVKLWKKDCNDLVAWHRQVLSNSRYRSTPMTFMDLNSNISVEAPAQVHGEFTHGNQKFQGAALAQMYKDHDMAFVDTFCPQQASFCGSQGNSWVDHIAVPRTFVPKVKYVRTLANYTKRLQLSPTFIDHRIVLMVSVCCWPFVNQLPAAKRWCPNALAKSLATGHDREAFIRSFNQTAQQHAPALASYKQDCIPDRHHQLLMEIVNDAGLRFFSQKSQTSPTQCAIRTERLQLMDDRKKLMQQTGGQPCEALSIVASQLKSLSRQLQVCNDNHWRQVADQLDKEIAEAYRGRQFSDVHKLCRKRNFTELA